MITKLEHRNDCCWRHETHSFSIRNRLRITDNWKLIAQSLWTSSVFVSLNIEYIRRGRHVPKCSWKSGWPQWTISMNYRNRLHSRWNRHSSKSNAVSWWCSVICKTIQNRCCETTKNKSFWTHFVDRHFFVFNSFQPKRFFLSDHKHQIKAKQTAFSRNGEKVRRSGLEHVGKSLVFSYGLYGIERTHTTDRNILCVQMHSLRP